MEKKWRVGDLQTMQGEDPRAMTMVGFVLYDETGQPCVTFGYETHGQARSARGYVMAALAQHVAPPHLRASLALVLRGQGASAALLYFSRSFKRSSAS